MTVRFDDAVNKLHSAGTPALAKIAWQELVEELGFLQYDYAFGHLETPQPKSILDFRFSHFSATRDWTEVYFDRRYHTVDVGSFRSLTTLTPWTYKAVFDRPPDNDLQREMLGEVKAAGVKSGLAVPLHGLGSQTGLMHLGCALQEPEFARLDRETRPIATLLAAYYHEHMLKLLEQAPAKGKRLSPRERECLLWVAKGKTSWEISLILGLSEATVNNMLASARRKLRVTTRTQAVAKAIAAGLILP